MRSSVSVTGGKMENMLFRHSERELKYLTREGVNATAEASLTHQRFRQQLEFQSQRRTELIRDAVGSHK